jgi:capsid protein
LAEIAAEGGRDLDEHLDEIQEGFRMLDERGIVLDSDPRWTTGAGLAQEPSDSLEEDEEDEDDD